MMSRRSGLCGCECTAGDYLPLFPSAVLFVLSRVVLLLIASQKACFGTSGPPFSLSFFLFLLSDHDTVSPYSVLVKFVGPHMPTWPPSFWLEPAASNLLLIVCAGPLRTPLLQVRCLTDGQGEASQGTRGAVSTVVYFPGLLTRPGDVVHGPGCIMTTVCLA